MAGREVREYTNLSDPKDKKWGKGKDRIDDEDITFQRMVAKCWRKPCGGYFLITCPDRDLGLSHRVVDAKQMQEVAGERGGYLHGRGALDSDDLLYLKEQMEAEEDAERLLRRTEKRAFAAFKRAANLADSTPVPVPLALRVEPKPKSGIRQQDLLKRMVEVKPKRQKVSDPANGSPSTPTPSNYDIEDHKPEAEQPKEEHSSKPSTAEISRKKEVSIKQDASEDDTVKSLLGLAYASSDDEED